MADKGSRCVLTKDQVVQIFERKLIPSSISSNPNGGSCTYLATKVGKEFGVSPKTVRDIWHGRTWYRQTYHLDPSRADAADRLSRHAGRPKGAKDRIPRQRKPAVSASDTKNESSYSTVCTTKKLHIRMQYRTYQDSGMQSAEILHLSFSKPLIRIARQAASNEANRLECAAFRSPEHGMSAIDSVRPAPCFPEDIFSEDGWIAFSDPFHDDWAYWPPKVGSAGTAFEAVH